MNDTTPEASEIQLRIYRRMSGAEKLQLAMRMSRDAREFSMARLRRAHPEWSDRDLKRELIRIAFLPRPLPAEID